jgi:DNA-binding NtrC family response regulator
MHAEVRSTRVLVVEDDPVFRVPLCAVLTAAGFDVRSADTPESAEARLAEEPVDVVLSDIGLPRMDGVALAARHPDTPFVLMTGSPPESSAALPPTVRARLVKPLDIPRLLALLREPREPGVTGPQAAGLRAAARH